MEVIKVLLILFYSVLIRNSSYALSTAYAKQSNNEVCACFNNTSQSIPQELGSDKNDFERLVIYLYHNIKTDQMHVYTPKREKQFHFPDLTFDVGDKLFETNSQIIIQLLNPNLSMEYGLNDKPQESKDQSLHELSFKNETENPLINEEIKKQDLIEPSDTPKELNMQFAQNDTSKKLLDSNETYKPTHEQYAAESEILPTEESHPDLTEDLTDYASPAHIQSDPGSMSFSKKDKMIPLAVSDDATLINSKELRPEKYSHGNGHSSLYQQHVSMYGKPKKMINNNLEVMNYGITAETDTPYYENFGLHTSEDVKYLKSQLFAFNNPFQFQSGSYVNNLQQDQTLIKANKFHSSDYTQSKPQELFFTFDKWFDQQMRRINTTSKSSNKNIDLHSLKLLIEKTLYENRMYVTKDGVLIDTYGNVLNVSNLKLLPILIGNSLPYKIILNVKNNRIELPTDVHFSQAILVTMLYPPKILGVIPLGTANVPKVSYRRRFNFWSTSSNTVADDEPLYVVRKAKHKKKHHHKNDNKNKNTPSITPRTVSAKFQHSTPKNSYTSTFKENPVTIYKSSVYQNDNNILNDKPYRKPNNDMNNFINTISSFKNFKGDIVKDDKSTEYKNKANNQDTRNNFQTFLKFYGDDKFAKENEVEDVNEEDLPGFRIIGGAPATGSGTPVVSRGRSGAFYE